MGIGHRVLAGLVGLAATLTAFPAAAQEVYFLASGRWDNTIIVIDLQRAIDPANDGTARAVVSRLRVTPDLPAHHSGGAAAPASGQPVSLAVSPDQRTAYVVNHSGSATHDAARGFQHGHAGSVTVVDLTRALDPAADGTLAAVVGFIDTLGAGPVAMAISPDAHYGVVTNSEGLGNEDGGREVTLIDLAARRPVRAFLQPWGNPGHACPPNPIPHASPHPSFGCFTDPTGIAISPRHGGTVFVGNGATDNVSVISLERLISGHPEAELGRVPMPTGSFGVTVSPDGALIAVANREATRVDAEGNTISLIDVDRAVREPAQAEVARILVGTDDPNVRSRPFLAAFTPDGTRLVVTTFRTNNVSIIDVRKALAREPALIARIDLATPSGAPSRPRGVAFSPDGRYAAITGAPRGESNSSVVWMLDLQTNQVVSRVTGIGNESYMIATWVRPR